MDIDLLRPILRRLPASWNHWAFAIFGTAATAFGFSALCATLPGPPYLPWVVAVSMGGAYWTFWYASTRVPRVRSGRIGVAIGIVADHEVEARRVQVDFVGRFRSRMHAAMSPATFSVTELPAWLASEMLESEEARESRFEEMGAQFLLLGEARLREDGKGEPVHILELTAVVRHRPISGEVQKRLFGGFSEAIPRRWTLTQRSDYLQFEATAAWMDIATRYYVAMTRLLVFDFDGALSLLEEVDQKLGTRQLLPAKPRNSLASRLPSARVEVLDAKRSWLVMRYFESQGPERLREAEEVSVRIHEGRPRHYGANLARAAAAFTLRRDLTAAKAFVERCSGNPHPAWRYSRAFLLAYSGEHVAAQREYLRAFQRPGGEKHLAIEVEQSIEQTIQEEPDNAGLRLASGMVNDYAKQDFALAIEGYSAFLQLAPEARLRQWTENRIAECRRYLADHQKENE